MALSQRLVDATHRNAMAKCFQVDSAVSPHAQCLKPWDSARWRTMDTAMTARGFTWTVGQRGIPQWPQ